MVLLLLACSVPERQPGERAPLSASCDDLDPTDCLLPWPSNTFTVVDESTETGLRLAVDPASLPVADDVSFLNLADGFSRITGVMVAFPEAIDLGLASTSTAPSLTADGLVQVINAQPGSARYGQRMAYWTEMLDNSSLGAEGTILIGRPSEILEANADHVFVVLDVGEAPRGVKVALGLEEPKGNDEKALFAYHAPTRAVLEEAGVDPKRVTRLSDFTTRSATDPTKRIHAMMATLAESANELTVEIDTVVTRSSETVAFIVRGRLLGAPSFLDESGHLVLDAEGNPVITGTAPIEFRMSVPEGEGSYKVALYGHGTGGDVTDNSFDNELGAAGIAKLNLRFDGWTGSDFVTTLSRFSNFVDGSAISTAGLMQSIAGGTVLMTALDGVLGETFTGATLGDQENPAAGRLPETDEVVWLGGSLGGTLGAVIVAADSRFRTAVLNVPGSGWTHMIPHSLLYGAGMESILLESYGDPLDMHLALVMSQSAWDDVDGAVWGDEALALGGKFLMQESMGDPVLPNLGTDLLASALKATQIEPVLEPIYGLPRTSEPVTTGTALEQFRVPDTGAYDVHGFAARDTIAGEAAFEQIEHLLLSAWAGAPEMVHPTVCTTYGLDGTCDFTEAMAGEE